MTTDIDKATREAWEEEWFQSPKIRRSGPARGFIAGFRAGAEWREQEQQQRVLEGWKLVPVRPTKEMLSAGSDQLYPGCGKDELVGLSGVRACSTNTRDDSADCWRHMLAAAPEPEQDG